MTQTQVQNVKVITTHRNLTAQKLRASISLALACSKDGDYDGMRYALSQLDVSMAEFKKAII